MELVSRNIAFTIVMLQNSKHGKESEAVAMDLLQSAGEVRQTLVLTIVSKFLMSLTL